LLKLEPTDDFLWDLVEFGNRNGLVSVEETFCAFYELEKNNASPLFNNFFFLNIQVRRSSDYYRSDFRWETLPAKHRNYNTLVGRVGGIASEYSSVDRRMSSVVFRLSFEIKFLKVVGRQTLGESEYRR
jgi:hypothetical protein